MTPPFFQADFQMRYRQGATISVALGQSTEGFSVTALFGPSGCGKTTTLRCIAGLERPQTGRITFGGEVWFDALSRISLPPQRRGIGFLFQDYALFPHLTVAGNVAYGLRSVRGVVRRQAVGEMLDRMELAHLANRYPRQLSGGEQQRIALARVLVRRPRLMLLDEPLSALDGPLREQLRGRLRHLLADFQIPVVLVTHDRLEALAVADQLVVMDGGAVQQTGDVQEVFSRPANLAVARIVGAETVQPARVIGIAEGLAKVAVGPVRLVAVAPEVSFQTAFVCIRAEDVILQKPADGHVSARNQLPAEIRSIVSEGPLLRVELDCGFRLTALVTRSASAELGLAVGDRVMALVKVPAVHLIPRE